MIPISPPPCRPPTARCAQDEVRLEESAHVSFVYDDSECSLVLLGATPEDAGVYTCTARNPAGLISCKAELVVRPGTVQAGGP